MKAITGSIVAIVTPMFEDGSLDLDGLRKLVDYHVQEGTDAMVVVGTTGESPTVDVEEHHQLIKVVVEQATMDPVIAFIIYAPKNEGCNSNRRGSVEPRITQHGKTG